MNPSIRKVLLPALLSLTLSGGTILAATPGQTPKEESRAMTQAEIRKSLEAFAAVPLRFDPATLSTEEREVLKRLVKAARLMDEVFLRQVWSGNVALRESLGKGDPDRFRLFQINFGPFDRLNENRPFATSESKPLGANFYPADLGKDEVERWIREHPADEKAFRSSFTVIRREGGKLVAVPYSQAYREFLEPAAALLREAAGLTTNPSLHRFLEMRARDLLTDDYYESDMAWMDLQGTAIEFILGPYEVYEDRLLGCKAAFEAFVTVKNPEESRKLSIYESHLTDMEKNLPLADEYKNFSRGKSSPMAVVDQVFSAGDTKSGVQTSAFNLPNDERVREAKGSKKVMLRNVMQAKFEKTLTPIADQVLDPSIRPNLDFQAFFDHVVLHEISHGLGPGRITVAGRSTTVSQELKELYPAIEECKADISGAWNLLYLMDKGVLPRRADQMNATFLAGLFRSVRFGIAEAHGLGVMIQYNYLKEKGAIRYDAATGKYRIEAAAMKGAIEGLSREVLTLEARGDYAAARALIARYGAMPSEVETTLGKLRDIPVDIQPVFQDVD